MKVQKVTLRYFRGIGEPVAITLKNGQSLLLYGDNGTGKSSFTDAIEWFATDNVSHLRGEEIDKHAGLRSALSKLSDECSVEIDFDSNKVGKKILTYIKDKLKAQFLDEESTKLAESLSTERFLIRNSNLIDFIINTKSDRLLEISTIIGYENVRNTTQVFKKAANSLRSLLKTQNFEGQIVTKKAGILQQLQATINTQEQFFDAINSQLKPFNFGLEVQDQDSLSKAIEFLKVGVDEKELQLKSTLEFCNKAIKEGRSRLITLNAQLAELANSISDLQKNQEVVKQISLARLLAEAATLLDSHEKDECPLCQQSIDRSALLALVKERINTLQQAQQSLNAIQDSKEVLLNALREVSQGLRSQLQAIQRLSITDLDLQSSLQDLDSIEIVTKEISNEVLKIDYEKASFKRDCSIMFQEIENKIAGIVQVKQTNNSQQKIDLLNRISMSKAAFYEIEKLEREKALIEKQITTLDKILADFIALQRDEMESFLNSITTTVNEYFLFMNDEAKIDAIELSTVNNTDGEFVGITIQTKFHGQLAPPTQFFSESFLNCLGLCIFLASVKLFNKRSKFFILDDVISSFDKPHRIRFGQLLDEKFSDYQILVLTHESQWFEFMANMVKGKGWLITQIRRDTNEEVCLELPAGDIKEQIEKQIHENDEKGLGNLVRRYTERLLKELCITLDAEVKFRFNDHNERRMPDELFSSLRGRLKEKSGVLSNAPVINKLTASKFIANLSSHDSSYQENIHDIKVAYRDLLEFDDLFRCSKCDQRVSVNNLNRSKKTISCKCGGKEISWKE